MAGVRHNVTSQQGAFVPKAEVHAKGSGSGMVAVMVQATAFHFSAVIQSRQHEQHDA
jgi:hypothetical protein